MKDQPEEIKRVYSLENASRLQIHNHRIQRAVQKFQKHSLDTGSSGVQIAIFTEKIIFMVNEFKRTKSRNKKLFRAIQTLLHHRQSHLEYLQKTDFHSFAYVVTEYKIPYSVKHITNDDIYNLPRFNSGAAKFSV